LIAIANTQTQGTAVSVDDQTTATTGMAVSRQSRFDSVLHRSIQKTGQPIGRPPHDYALAIKLSSFQ